jgi:hypothetical protein
LRAFEALRFFFVGMAFPACRRAGSDDSNLVTLVRMRNHKEAAPLRPAY